MFKKPQVHFRILNKQKHKDELISFRIYLALNEHDYQKSYYDQFDLITQNLTKLMKKMNTTRGINEARYSVDFMWQTLRIRCYISR